MKKNIKKIIKIFLLIFLVLIIGSFIFIKTTNIIHNTKLLDKHKDYLDLPKHEQKIEEWMTIQFISKNFDIGKKDIKKYLNKSDFKIRDKQKSLSKLCEKNEIDCKKLIQNLNKELK